jgi:hypothetical protein
MSAIGEFTVKTLHGYNGTYPVKQRPDSRNSCAASVVRVCFDPSIPPHFFRPEVRWFQLMKSKDQPRKVPRKLGTEAHDPAKTPREIDKNFKQSADIRQDRGTAQEHRGSPKGKVPGR